MNNLNSDIYNIILTQKREWDQRLTERYIPRKHASIPADDDMARIIVGPRRAGKSFFALHEMARGTACGYINFDDERLPEVDNYDDIIHAADLVYGNPPYLILDEVQNLPRWELLVNRLQRQGRRMVVTGSNSNLLSSELATHLTGRHIPIPILPFDFSEFLHLHGPELTSSEKSALMGDYIRRGGFPEPLIKSMDAAEYLRVLLNAVLYKDIVKRHRIRAVQGMEDMAHYLLSNIAKEFSFQTLSRVTRCRSAATTEKYLRYLEETFLLFTLKRFSFKAKKQYAYNKKIYCVDNALALAGGFRVSEDAGRMYENALAVHLWKQALSGHIQLYFWKGARGEEVDFVIKRGPRIESLIQVCVHVDTPKVFDRETRALIAAGRELDCSRLLVITEDREAVETVEWFGDRAEIHFMPAWKWCLESPWSESRSNGQSCNEK